MTGEQQVGSEVDLVAGNGALWDSFCDLQLTIFSIWCSISLISVVNLGVDVPPLNEN